MRCCEKSRKDERRAREGSVQRVENERRGLSVDGKDQSIDPSLPSYLFYVHCYSLNFIVR